PGLRPLRSRAHERGGAPRLSRQRLHGPPLRSRERRVPLPPGDTPVRVQVAAFLHPPSLGERVLRRRGRLEPELRPRYRQDGRGQRPDGGLVPRPPPAPHDERRRRPRLRHGGRYEVLFPGWIGFLTDRDTHRDEEREETDNPTRAAAGALFITVLERSES